MRLVDNDRTKEVNIFREDDITESDTTSSVFDVVDEVFAQRLIVDDGNLIHAYTEKISPCGAIRVVEDERLLIRELLELSLPVDFER